jgi:Mitochondrial ribosomal subunit S27
MNLYPRVKYSSFQPYSLLPRSINSGPCGCIHVSSRSLNRYYKTTVVLNNTESTKNDSSNSLKLISSIKSLFPPSDAATADVAEARRQIFGVVQGNNKRSGRKVLRSRMKGEGIKSWYPTNIDELKLDAVGIQSIGRDAKYELELEMKRMGKTRIKGKLRPPTKDFMEHVKVREAQDLVLDQVDWFYPEDALPDEEIVDELLDGLDAEEQKMLGDVFSEMVASVEDTRLESLKTASPNDKVARARGRTSLRRSLDDKRTEIRDDGNAEGGSDENLDRIPVFPSDDVEIDKLLKELDTKMEATFGADAVQKSQQLAKALEVQSSTNSSEKKE